MTMGGVGVGWVGSHQNKCTSRQKVKMVHKPRQPTIIIAEIQCGCPVTHVTIHM
jgi:hypothetical protein